MSIEPFIHSQNNLGKKSLTLNRVIQTDHRKNISSKIVFTEGYSGNYIHVKQFDQVNRYLQVARIYQADRLIAPLLRAMCLQHNKPCDELYQNWFNKNPLMASHAVRIPVAIGNEYGFHLYLRENPGQKFYTPTPRAAYEDSFPICAYTQFYPFINFILNHYGNRKIIDG